MSGGAREQLDGAVAQVGLGRVVGRRLGVTGVGRQRVPTERLLAVGVGEHELGALGGQVVQAGRIGGQGARVVDRAGRVEEAQSRQVVQPRGVALDDEGAGVGLAAQHGPGVGHGVGHDRRGPGDVGRGGEVLLVQRRVDGDVGLRRAEAEGVGQPERRLLQLAGQELGLWNRRNVRTAGRTGP